MRLKSLMSPKQIECRLHQIIFDMQRADELLLSRIDFDTVSPREMRLLAAALLTGDTQYIRTGDEASNQSSLAPEWGSWIEGQPFSSAILGNRAVLVDLHPLDAEQFALKYRCTVGQFIAILKWFVRQRKRIFINLISLNQEDPHSFDRYAAQTETIGLILQEIEDNSLFYCLPVRRNLMFAVSEGGAPLDRQRLSREKDWAQEFVDECYGRLEAACAAIPANPDERSASQRLLLGAVVRGGHIVGQAQLAWRIAYYRAYQRIFQVAPEGEIESILRSASPTAEEIAELTRLITLYHHRYTAPITGAFGGTYNLRMAEYGPMIANIGLDPSERIRGTNVYRALSDAEDQLWRWIATEQVTLEDGKLRNAAGTWWAMVQRQQTIDDQTVDYILNQGKPITDDILAYRDDLLRGLRQAIFSSSRLRRRYGIEDDEEWRMVEQVDTVAMTEEMDRAVTKANNIMAAIGNRVMIKFGVSSGLGLAGAGLATVGLAHFGLPTLLASAAGGALETGATEYLTRTTGRIYPRTQIVEVLENIEALRVISR